MSYIFYRRILIALFVTFTLIYIITPVVNYLIGFWGPNFIWIIFLYAKPFLSVALLYFGVYAYIVGIKSVSHWESPIAVIIVGLLFVLLAYGPSLISYNLINKNNITLNSEDFRNLEDNAVNKNVSFNDRLSSARLVYIETGKVIKYLDESNILVDYMPDKAAEEKRSLNVKYEHESRKLAVETKNHLIINLLIAITVSFVFVGYFLFYRLTKKSIKM